MKVNLKRQVLNFFCILSGVLGLSGGMVYYIIMKLGKSTKLGYLSFIKKFSTEIVIMLILLIISFLFLLVKNNKMLQTNLLKVKYLLISIITVIISSYITLCLFAYLVQDELIIKNNLIFQPKPSISYDYNNVEQLKIKTDDNNTLQGYIVKNSNNDKAPLIIYFGGSGEEVSDMIFNTENLDGWNVALFNYRGFGTSTGIATQNSSFNDAKLIYDTLSQRKDIDSSKIVTMGWSRGTGISVYLSSVRPIKATILVAPMENVYNKYHVPLIPLSILMKQRFDSSALAPNINSPLLCLIGESDVNVSPKQSMNLVKKWKGPSTVKTYKNDDHHLLFHANNSWQDILNFLKGFE